jgi:hypothetical protein
MAPHDNEMQRAKPTLAREPWSSLLILVLDRRSRREAADGMHDGHPRPFPVF